MPKKRLFSLIFWANFYVDRGNQNNYTIYLGEIDWKVNMRVIAGTARSLVLWTPEGMDVRPTTDKIKETLFNILMPDIPDCRFLDMFAGSGGIGIEALSRGAKEAVFIDSNRTSIGCIKKNLEHTRLADRGRVLGMDFLSAIATLKTENKAFDIIFIDPPYRKGLEMQALSQIAFSKLVNEDTVIIVEAALETELEGLEELGFEAYRTKKYKTNQHIFIHLKTEAEE